MTLPDRKFRTIVLEITDPEAFRHQWGAICDAMAIGNEWLPGAKVTAAAIGDELSRLEELEQKHD